MGIRWPKLLLLLALLVTTGCGGDDDDGNGSPTGPEIPEGSRVSATIDRQSGRRLRYGGPSGRDHRDRGRRGRTFSFTAVAFTQGTTPAQRTVTNGSFDIVFKQATPIARLSFRTGRWPARSRALDAGSPSVASGSASDPGPGDAGVGKCLHEIGARLR